MNNVICWMYKPVMKLAEYTLQATYHLQNRCMELQQEIRELHEKLHGSQRQNSLEATVKKQ